MKKMKIAYNFAFRQAVIVYFFVVDLAFLTVIWQ